MKTLKDFKSAFASGAICEGELRLEAIKWIKELEKGILNIKALQKRDLGREGESILQVKFEAKIEWIKEFFNLTDEDLSDNSKQR